MIPGRARGLLARNAGRLPAESGADLVVAGGGLGGCAAALAAGRQGLRVVMTEESDWIGGQLTAQAVPLDENQWIESGGGTASYHELRRRIREYYARNFPLTATARANPALNPGNGTVSRLCHEPRVGLAVLREMLAPLGALLPRRVENLLPACKNIGTTHITNGCFRLHPVEWNIGEAAGSLAAFCVARRLQPRTVRARPKLLAEFQRRLVSLGIPLAWPEA